MRAKSLLLGDIEVVSATIYVVPLAKARPRMTRQGHVYTPKATLTLEAEIRDHLLRSFDGPPLQGALGLHCTFFIPKPKSVRRLWPSVKPDLDNYLKSLLDAGNGVVWSDDSQIVDLHTKKIYAPSEREARIEITVWRV